MLFKTAGSIAGPAMAGFTYDATEGYNSAFLAFAGMSMLPCMLLCFARLPVPRRVKEAAAMDSPPSG